MSDTRFAFERGKKKEKKRKKPLNTNFTPNSHEFINSDNKESADLASVIYTTQSSAEQNEWTLLVKLCCVRKVQQYKIQWHFLTSSANQTFPLL